METLRALTVATLLVGLGCSGPESSAPAGPRAAGPPRALIESRQTGVKILLVGIDGATFTVMDPLLESGELPNLAGLIDGGAHGVLESDRPMRSPALWTTISTGLEREDHGVAHFTEHDEEGGQVLANSTMRSRLTIWDMLGAAGHTVGISGWWATWPAEPVRGWLVSDRMTRSRWSEWTDGVKQEGVTYPPDLADDLFPLVVDPMNPPMSEIRRVVDLSPDEEIELLAATRPLRAHGLSVLKFALSNQLTYERITTAMLERGQPDLLSVFLIANDAVSHNFWHYHRPERYPELDRATDVARRMAPVVGNLYRHNDAYLGSLLEAVDESTVTVVVSDHGFRASGKLPSARPWKRVGKAFSEEFAQQRAAKSEAVTVGQSGVHQLDGIFIAAGGPIVPGSEVRATLLDMAPTLLALMGMPVPDDLPGRILTEILAPEFLENHPIERIPSYESIVDRTALLAAGQEGENDESTLEMLRSLGYIQ